MRVARVFHRFAVGAAPAKRWNTRVTRTRQSAWLVGVLAAMLAVSSCAAPGDDESNGETSDRAIVAVALPDSAVGTQASWVLSVLNAADATSETRITQHLAQMMLDEVPASGFIEVFEQLRSAQPWVPTHVDAQGSRAVITLASPSSDALDMSISVDRAGQVDGLFFAPSAAERTPATDWSELEAAVHALPAATSMSVERVGDPGPSEPFLAVDADTTKPVGSAFKLYVLGAVVDAIAADRLGWDDPLTLTDDLRSLPSGTLQDEPAGTVVTVREAAELMISISDNTATDMLMDAVGRDAVERAQARLGHHDPTLNTPFLTTREMFRLGWGEAVAVRDRWAQADVAERRSIVQGLAGGPLDVDPAAVTDPVWQYGLDWFANAADLRAAHLGLQQLAETAAGEPVRDILALNPGAGLSIGDEWTYVAFKGGSSVGELAGSWYVERTDGEGFTLSIQAASEDPTDLADPRAYFGQIEDALALLAG